MRLTIMLTGIFLLAEIPGRAGFINIGHSKQFFFDDKIVESLRDTRRILNPAEKVANNPILRPERPWEGNTLTISLVYYDDEENLFKMRYGCSNIKARQQGGKTVFEGYTVPSEISNTCLAVSEDGIHWERPSLGLVEFRGSKDNNILPPEWLMGYIYRDLHTPDSAQRFRAHERIGEMSEPGMIFNAFTSPDGKQWQPYAGNPIIRYTGTGRWGPTNFMGWDPIRKVYAVFMENCLHRICPLHKRVIGRAESPDGIHWSEPETIILPDENDPPDLEFYELAATPYDGILMGMLWNFRSSAATHHPELVLSRDGVRFQRDFRQPFIARGAQGEFDHISLLAVNPVVHGDRIYYYYYGRNSRSLVTLEELGERAIGAIGLATLPRDGFVSLDGGKDRFSVMVTRSFSFSGSQLYVNFDSALEKAWGGGPGDVRVEVLSANHQPLEGLGFEDVDPVRTGNRAQLITWKGRSDLSHLAEQSIRLRFHFKNARLYSFWFQ